ncbi:MAG TPA: PBP1A family penicillin-binding protein [Gemmatimonadales bacterium]|jgi:penicillin-binding protein 1A|nr:PBP1A family penicillin-binding protein [Gemmatimonadales bacterium]
MRVRLSPRAQRIVLVSSLAVVALALAILLAAWTRACAGNSCPSIAGLGGYDPKQASKVYAADGRLITDLGLERRTVVPLVEMSPYVKAAFITTEDKRFYQHHGIDWVRVLGAIKNNVFKFRVAEGFSTITMQLARNLWPEDISGRDKSLRRKLREAHVAQEIEAKYSKDKILELYLNQIDLGNRAYGVEAASQRYFGKSVRDLNVAEAATLAAIPKAPSRYNPRKNPNLSLQRRNTILNLLRDNDLLSPEEAERWKAYPLLLSSHSDYSGVAEYFVEHVRRQLDARFGPGLYRAGYRIYTTLDLDIQQAAERALEARLEAIESGADGPFPHKTYRQYMDSRSESTESGDRTPTPYLQGLVVTLDAKTGNIRAMVGGRDFDDSKFNRATQARRQPGSTFKPLVYAAALQAGYPLSYVMVDDPLSVEIDPAQDPWTPQNYDLEFDGPMTLRRALYLSRNIIAIKLGMEIGPDAVISEATKFGITTPIRPYPSIYIGSADVYPLEMIAAYTAFANLGTRTLPNSILRVEDRSGKIVWQPPVRSVTVMDTAHAWLMTDVLRDVVRHGTAVGSVGARINFPAAGKTGTTNDGFDVWFIGFTPDLVTGVWIGFDQPQKIKGNAQGGVLAAPAWTAMMREVYERRELPAAWPRPDGLTALDIDKTTGYKATPFCPKDVHYIESFIPGTEPTQFCPIHSPFGAVGSTTGPLGGTAPAAPPPVTPAPGAPPPGTPLQPGAGSPKPGGGTPTPSRPGTAAPPPGAMGGAGPPGSQPH